MSHRLIDAQQEHDAEMLESGPRTKERNVVVK